MTQAGSGREREQETGWLETLVRRLSMSRRSIVQPTTALPPQTRRPQLYSSLPSLSLSLPSFFIHHNQSIDTVKLRSLSDETCLPACLLSATLSLLGVCLRPSFSFSVRQLLCVVQHKLNEDARISTQSFADIKNAFFEAFIESLSANQLIKWFRLRQTSD